MATPASQLAEAVEVKDEMGAALEAGFQHASEFYRDGQNTLIDQISQADWDLWDARDESALISDPDGIDLPDQSDCDLAA